MHNAQMNCYNDIKNLLLKGHVQTFLPSITVQTAFLPAFSHTFPRWTISETILFWGLCQDPSSRSDQAGTLTTLVEQEDKHFDSRRGNPLWSFMVFQTTSGNILKSQACLGPNRSLPVFGGGDPTSCSIAHNHWKWNRPHCQNLYWLTPTRLHNGILVPNPAWGTHICPTFSKSWDTIAWKDGIKFVAVGCFAPLGRPRRIWKDNIKMDLQEVGWGAWTGSIRLRRGTGGRHLQMNLRVP